MLVSSLLRLVDQRVNVTEGERLLRARGKPNELLLLYKHGQMHQDGKLYSILRNYYFIFLS